jgi:hypothetical protein
MQKNERKPSGQRGIQEDVAETELRQTESAPRISLGLTRLEALITIFLITVIGFILRWIGSFDARS